MEPNAFHAYMESIDSLYSLYRNLLTHTAQFTSLPLLYVTLTLCSVKCRMHAIIPINDFLPNILPHAMHVFTTTTTYMSIPFSRFNIILWGSFQLECLQLPVLRLIDPLSFHKERFDMSQKISAIEKITHLLRSEQCRDLDYSDQLWNFKISRTTFPNYF